MRVQSLLLPNINFQQSEDLYFKGDNRNYTYVYDDGLYIHKQGTVDFNSYYNAFFVKEWLENTNVNEFQYNLDIEGEYYLTVVHTDITGIQKVLLQKKCNTNGNTVFNLNLDKIKSGYIYFKIEAITETQIKSGYISTNASIIREVKLAIIITHFNRVDYVKPAIERIKEQLLDDNFFGDLASLYVIDNSKNINLEENYHSKITVIKNKNLGGSGGFCRGLLEAESTQKYTHCLFMDDDASCEIDSIKRTISFLMYAIDPNLSVSGALFRELESNRLIEKGGFFDGMAKPLSHNLSMSDNKEMLLSVTSKTKPNYGAWWFFAFPIDKVKYYPFPFFVRGDDIQFSLLNKFNIITLMGVGCIGEDFGLKSSPMTRYLDTRHTLVQNIAVEHLSYLYIVKNAAKFFFGALLGFNYDSARCASLAISDFCKGARFWEENIDMSEIRAEIGKKFNNEKMIDIELDKLDTILIPPLAERRFRKIIRKISIQGLLLPNFLFRKKILIQPKHSSIDLVASFRAKKILHYYEPFGKGYITEFNRYRISKEILFFIKQLIKLKYKFKRLNKEYQIAIDLYTSKTFWKEIYK
ncbi:MAG: hypothetical protein CENE_02089 [Candidatus Celerinatantimonas neptuna]|nr:MAG: hypothetical protein CENE_02089 [Candidatus Celerinatantimonas neptuna]